MMQYAPPGKVQVNASTVGLVKENLFSFVPIEVAIKGKGIIMEKIYLKK